MASISASGCDEASGGAVGSAGEIQVVLRKRMHVYVGKRLIVMHIGVASAWAFS
jgi:hypothetical protein